MALVTRFRELRVYQQAFEAAARIFELSKGWPKEERYSLTDQIRVGLRKSAIRLLTRFVGRLARYVPTLPKPGASAATRVTLSASSVTPMPKPPRPACGWTSPWTAAMLPRRNTIPSTLSTTLWLVDW